MKSTFALRANGVSLVLTASSGRLPKVVHWGADLGDVTGDDAEALTRADHYGIPNNALDIGLELGILPEARWGWTGTPGIVGSRNGKDWSPSWEVVECRVDGSRVEGFVELGAGTVEFDAVAPDSGLALTVTVELLPSGLIRVRARLTNTCDDIYELQELGLRFPVPGQADELLDFAGRWAVERMPQRQVFGVGAHRREGRHGRTGADAAFILNAGRTGFSYDSGEVWATHVAWSGNHVHIADQDFQGGKVIGGGELLLPGEGRLEKNEAYTSPWVYFIHSTGLDQQAERFHSYLRSLPVHPDSERPVTLNVWEAVYFDHDLARLSDLADRAATLGVERYVLDDGWFGSRRDDHSGLGDWVVSTDMWPDGLGPLVDKVTGLGMQFGLWFEPEMVNMDSDVARAHPEWVMQVADRLPVESRHQQVLNLTVPGAYQHVLEQVSAVLGEYEIGYVKWDHNRDLVDAGTVPGGRAAVSGQTAAYYRLLDELRGRFPDVEFESCSSGGSRIDLEVLTRVERVWVSDNIDPDDRQRMLWWTGQMLPLELMGSHVASGRSHVTGRWHDLNYRAATAVFGHLGIEWDLAEATQEELDSLGRWITFYKEHRHTLHTGRLVRIDLPYPGVYAKGVVTNEQAIYSIAQLQATSIANIGHVRLPGLDPDRRYRLHTVDGTPVGAHMQAPWVHEPEGIVLTGRQLAAAGLRAPTLRPSTAILIVCDAL